MCNKILSLALIFMLLLSVFPVYTSAAPNAEVSSPETTQAVETKAATWDVDGDGTLSLLAIGNSFSVDGLQYFWNIARSLGISKVVLGNLYIGGCSLATHYTNAKNDSASYTYYYNDNGTWKTTSSYKMSTALKARSWDYVSMQQNSGNSGLESTYNSNLTNLITYVKGKLTNSKTKLVWHMTWAYQKDSTHSSFANYDKNQTTMYNGIVTAVTNKILTNSNFDRVIPNGTAVQNMRSSYVGDTLTRDGYHMSYDQGRFLVALMFVKSITGLDVAKNTYRPSGVSDTYAYVAVNAVNKAYSTPLKISKSVYNGNNPSSGYIQIQPKLTKGGFWHSTSAEYNTVHTTASNSSQYFCTPRMKKAELPVGTIILVKSGWKYRPEGWVTDAKQSSRPDPTTDKLVVVTENWWSNFTLRAFNISKTDGSSITSLSAADILSNFRIFVPESIYLKDHIQIKPDLHKGAYWHPQKEGSFNKLITNASNSPNFFATPRFTKSQLPVGSVILVKGGLQYRPDGWINDVLQTGTREAVTSQYSVICDSTWWGKYTIRAFNISLTAGGAITGKTQDDIYKNFKIYVPKSSHTHTAASNPVITAPTCTAGGYTTYTCTMCKQTYTGAQTAALGHSLTSTVTAPTCTAEGFTTHTCTRCKQVTTDTTVPALGHSLDSVVTPPTCTAEGYTTHTCTRCKQVTTDTTVPALGHSYDSVVTPPTCTADGYTTHTCTRCKDVTTDTVVPAPGHSITSVVTPPTCTAGGYTTYTCSLCGQITTGEETAPMGHAYAYAVLDRERHTVTCSRCDYAETAPHAYADGTCICGEAEVYEPVLAPELKINHSLNLASDISVNLLVAKSLLEGYDLSTVYLSVELDRYEGNTQLDPITYTIQPVDQGSFYYFTLEGLTATQMNDGIRSVLHGVKNGRPYYSPVDRYSIADYAYSQLNKIDVAPGLKKLCADLLRYGASAQIFKAYRTDALADSYMTEEDSAYLSNLDTVTFGNTNTVLTDLADPALVWTGKALELNSKVTLKFVFALGSYTGAVEDLALLVSYTDRLGQTRQLRLTDPQAYGAGNTHYSFTFDGLLAAELRSVVSARIYAGDTPLSCTLQYSADTYGANKTGALGDLCKALFAYSDSAKAYFPGN